MDIEERAEKWIRDNFSAEFLAGQDEGFQQHLIDAYLAGVGQARADEAAHQRYLADKRLNVRLGPPGVGQ